MFAGVAPGRPIVIDWPPNAPRPANMELVAFAVANPVNPNDPSVVMIGSESPANDGIFKSEESLQNEVK